VSKKASSSFGWSRQQNRTFADRALEGFTQALGFKPAADERRGQTRLPAHARVTLVLADEANGEKRTHADVLDISPGGIAIRSPKAAPVGAVVEIREGGFALSGIVRRVTPDGKEFALGVQIQSDGEPRLSPGVRLLA
jgi:hypothetical protein